MRARAGERFSTEVTLTPESVAGFARDVGDDNPVHHDPQFAAGTRFGRLIASGPHTTALLLALTAAHFSKRGAMLGLEFWQRFRKPVFADETILLEWLVVKVTPSASLARRRRRTARAHQGSRRAHRGRREGPRPRHRRALGCSRATISAATTLRPSAGEDVERPARGRRVHHLEADARVGRARA